MFAVESFPAPGCFFFLFFLFFGLGEGGAGRAVCCSILSGGQGWPGLSPPFFFHPGMMLGMLALKSMT